MPRKLTVPTSDVISKKWGDVTPARSSYYESETPGASAIWESGTTGAKGTYKQAVADPKIADRFAGGVKGKAAKFARKVKDVGIARFGPGVSAAVADMKDGFDPYVSVLAATEVPDRGPRGDSGNYRIVDKIGDVLHKKRLAVLGAAPS